MKISRKFTLGDHILNSHDLRGGISIDIARRNLMLITVRPRTTPVRHMHMTSAEEIHVCIC